MPILKTTKPQELFDLALTGIRTQQRPSIDLSGRCVYKAGIARCGAGHCMTDEAIDWAISNNCCDSVYCMYNQIKDTSDIVITKGDINALDLLQRLQTAHDEAYALFKNGNGNNYIRFFNTEMIKVASVARLKYNH